jgi:hypothetical protein
VTGELNTYDKEKIESLYRKVRHFTIMGDDCSPQFDWVRNEMERLWPELTTLPFN